jgi:hypothetical protein
VSWNLAVRQLLILAIALAVLGGTGSLVLARVFGDGPVAEVHKPLHPAAKQRPVKRLAAWLQTKVG